MPPLRSLDLFSGIGGITHALRGLGIAPEAYCELNPHAVDVLRERMRVGDLPTAVVHPDVTTLSSKHFKTKIDLIAAGFPCFVAGTLVLTRRGYVPIEDVLEDDLLMTHTGAFREIVNTQRKVYDGGMCEVTVVGHSRPVVCTEEHPFYARRRTATDPPAWVPAKDLTRNHEVGFKINTESAVACDKTPDEWFALGYCLGHGAWEDGRLRFTSRVKHEVALAKLEDYRPVDKPETVDGEVPEWMQSAPRDALMYFIDGYQCEETGRRSSVGISLALQRMCAKVNSPGDEYAWFRIGDVVRSRAAAEGTVVYNFQVDVDDSYVVEPNVAVHNCTGFSVAGERKGFDNPGTGLYGHVVRLIDELDPPLVFLENVASIRSQGLDRVAETLHARGYTASWVTLYGYNVGCPQYRHRWFCLAAKRGYAGGTLRLEGPYRKFDWSEEPVPRMVVDQRPVRGSERWALLGNSVIPDVVRWAFLYLYTGSVWSANRVLDAESWTFAAPDPERIVSKRRGVAGMVDDMGKNRTILPPEGLLGPTAEMRLTLDPDAYDAKTKNPKQTQEKLPAVVHKKMWSTPRYKGGYGTRVITDRTSHDLGTQLRFEARTPDHLRDGVPNPDFIEWLMGFERGWTIRSLHI